MAEKYVSLGTALLFKIKCKQCGIEQDYRSQRGAEIAADLHEIFNPEHEADVLGFTEQGD